MSVGKPEIYEFFTTILKNLVIDKKLCLVIQKKTFMTIRMISLSG